MEVRELYYELWIGDNLVHEGSLEQCKRFAEDFSDREVVEIYAVKTLEEKVEL